MDTGNLERVEILKGPASLMSGEGATGGAINFVTRAPHEGPIESEAYLSYGSFHTARAGFGSGGSTSLQGLAYRFDLNRASSNGFIDDTHREDWHLSTGLDFRLSSDLKLFGAFEYKRDRSSAYWGTPLVSAAAPGIVPSGGIVSGTSVSSFSGNDLGAVTIDGRTLKTLYNVLDNRNRADEYWLRGGLEWKLSNSLTFRNQAYAYTAEREFLNSEVVAFDPATGLVDRDRFYVSHSQNLVGNKAELLWDTKPGGMDNRAVVAFEASKLHFDPQQAANFPSDSVTLVDPIRGTYGPLVIRQLTASVGNTAIAVEDRLKLTPAFALVAGLRYEEIALDRSSFNAAGALNPGFPYSTSFHPATGRLGFTWEAMPGFALYGQYATAADLAANNLFSLGPLQRAELTTGRTYEAGVKHLLRERKAEWTFALFDIQRKNVFADQSGHQFNVAGKQVSHGFEIAAAVRPGARWNVWGNLARTWARYEDYVFAGGSFSGHMPPNVPKIVANAGASYRFDAPVPVQVGASVRHVGDRYTTDANTVTLLSYTVADAYAYLDVRKTRIAFRVRNLTDRKYAIWSDPGYPDQVLLGAPRSYEVSASIKF
jgi:iron complex outermembrane receptor protein